MLRIVLKGDPTAQARMRMFRRGNKTMVFDPQGSLKRDLKIQILDQIGESSRTVFKCPRIVFWFYMSIPKSMSKKQRLEANTGLLKHLKKPDIDNLIKLYLDVLVGTVLEDDNCVSLGQAIKIYSPIPRTVIFVEEMEETINLHETQEGKWTK